MKTVQVPFGFNARDYQKPLFNSLFTGGKKRGIAVWHRRAGKDKVFMAMLASAAIQRTGIYFYMLPYYAQARKVIWEGMDSTGTRNLAVFPDEVIKRKRNQEMILELVNGSLVYFVGSDNIDSIVGTNPIGVFFSEFSLHKVAAWDFLRPILVENGGFAYFNGTPRGKNHMYKMLKSAEENPDTWFSEVLDIDDTGVMTKEQVDMEIANGMEAATAKQEFYCSFDAALVGAFYDEVMQAATMSNRITTVPHDPYLEVNVSWDLGVSDTCVLVFHQNSGLGHRIIDCVYNEGKGLDWYVQEMRARPYTYGEIFLPHDIKAREITTGKTRLSKLYELGLKNLTVLPKASIQDGIEETRRFLAKAHIDDKNCGKLVEALRGYRRQWDPDRQVFSKIPVHDWSSHFADSVRGLAMGLREKTNLQALPSTALGTGYDPINSRDESYPYHNGPQQLEPLFGGRYGNDVNVMSWNPVNHTIADGYYE